jgi:hypothetical protein
MLACALTIDTHFVHLSGFDCIPFVCSPSPECHNIVRSLRCKLLSLYRVLYYSAVYVCCFAMESACELYLNCSKGLIQPLWLSVSFAQVFSWTKFNLAQFSTYLAQLFDGSFCLLPFRFVTNDVLMLNLHISLSPHLFSAHVNKVRYAFLQCIEFRIMVLLPNHCSPSKKSVCSTALFVPSSAYVLWTREDNAGVLRQSTRKAREPAVTSLACVPRWRRSPRRQYTIGTLLFLAVK